jgi:hypothetical protein
VPTPQNFCDASGLCVRPCLSGETVNFFFWGRVVVVVIVLLLVLLLLLFFLVVVVVVAAAAVFRLKIIEVHPVVCDEDFIIP